MYLEPCQTTKTVRFAKIVQPLTFLEKRGIFDVWQGSEYASEVTNDCLKTSLFVPKWENIELHELLIWTLIYSVIESVLHKQ